MSIFFIFLLLGAIAAVAHVLYRRHVKSVQNGSAGTSRRDTMLWGACLIVGAAVDYFLTP